MGTSNAGATAFLPLKNPFSFENEEEEPARSEIDVTSVTAAAYIQTLKSHKAALNIVKLENPIANLAPDRCYRHLVRSAEHSRCVDA